MNAHWLDKLKPVVTDLTGLRIEAGDDETLRKVIGERLAHRGLDSPEDYLAMLSSPGAASTAECDALIAALTPGETFFFRDTGQFELLRRTLLPELIDRRAERRALLLWSAGCSTGEEIYSLAIMLDELGSRVAGWQIKIIGTDVNEDAIAKARAGVYGEWSFRGMDPGLRQRHFRPLGRHWVLNDTIRRMVSFGCCNLVRDEYPSYRQSLCDIDLIVCRNVLLYLRRPIVDQVLAKLVKTLAPDGYLMTGHNELFAQKSPLLIPRMYPQSVVYQRVQPGSPEAPLKRQHTLPQRPAKSVASTVAAIANADSQEEPELKRAWTAANSGKLEEARSQCLEHIARDPLDFRPYFLLSQIALDSADSDEGRTLLNKVIYLDPDNIAAHLQLATLAEAEGNPETARRLRATAAHLLRRLAPESPVPFMGETAGEVLAFLENQEGSEARPLSS